MSKYTELDKNLKKIRNNRDYDLYKMNLESQKKIDEFYDEEIPENDMMMRKCELNSYISRRNILCFPIIITIIFGLLVNLVFTKFDGYSDFFKLHDELQAIPVGAEGVNMLDLAGLYIMLYMLLFVVTGVFVCIFFIPFPPLYFLFDMDKTREQQIEYELTVLNDKINEKIKENKNGKEYNGCVKKNTTKQILYIICSMIVLFLFAYSWRLSCEKIIVLTFIGAIVGYNVSIINKGNEK